MRDAADDGVAQAAQGQHQDQHQDQHQAKSRDRNDACRAVVSDLVSLVEHVRKCLRLIEQTIAEETPLGGPESSTNVIVLDDVSPRYAKAAAAVQACNVNLEIALRSLLDAGNGDRFAAGQRVPSLIGA
jgi:hypothetical protein